jgi:hypothetical protein
MKKFIFVATLSAALLLSFSACHHRKGVQGSGVRKTEKRDLGAFKSIETNGAFEVQVTCQQSPSFEIEGDDNILPLITTQVRDGVLNISNDTGYRTAKGIIVRIGTPDVESVTSHGAGNIHITDIKNERLAISTTGAANIKAAGQTQFVSISSTGAGKIDADKLHAERAKVTVTGAAIVEVYANQRLDATVSGVGQVTYAGSPGVVNRSVSGVGRVTKKEGA